MGWLSAKSENMNSIYFFVHYYAPLHKAPPKRNYIELNGIKLLSWLAYSPDLNLIENVWSMMKHYIQPKYR